MAEGRLFGIHEKLLTRSWSVSGLLDIEHGLKVS
jgi:hypothetical protein